MTFLFPIFNESYQKFDNRYVFPSLSNPKVRSFFRKVLKFKVNPMICKRNIPFPVHIVYPSQQLEKSLQIIHIRC